MALRTDIPCVKPHLAVRGCLAFLSVIFGFMGLIMTLTAGGDSNEWLGKWYDTSATEKGDYICSTSAIAGTDCPNRGTWKKLGDVCFLAASENSQSVGPDVFIHTRYRAQQICVEYGANLATISSAAEDAFAYKMCDPRQGTCYFGLRCLAKCDALGSWNWFSAAPAPYRNWWTTGGAEEPTGGEGGGGRRGGGDNGAETAVSWVTSKTRDDVQGMYFFAMIFTLVWFLLVMSCCTMNTTFVWCGIQKSNSCCLTSAASLDGVMAVVMFLFGIGSLFGGNIGGLISNLLIGALFLTGSIMGCCQCGPVNTISSTPAAPPPAVIGMVVQVQ